MWLFLHQKKSSIVASAKCPKGNKQNRCNHPDVTSPVTYSQLLANRGLGHHPFPVWLITCISPTTSEIQIYRQWDGEGGRGKIWSKIFGPEIKFLSLEEGISFAYSPAACQLWKASLHLKELAETTGWDMTAELYPLLNAVSHFIITILLLPSDGLLSQNSYIQNLGGGHFK